MQAAATWAPRKLHLAGACLAVIAVLALATPARAAEPDYKGWFAALDAEYDAVAPMEVPLGQPGTHRARLVTGPSPGRLARIACAARLVETPQQLFEL